MAEAPVLYIFSQMTNLLPETHTALNKTIKGVAYNHETKKLEETTFTFTDLEKQVMNQFPIDWYVDDLEDCDYGMDDPADWLIDWADTKRLVKKLNITEEQLKGVCGSLINKGALDVESRGDTEAEKARWGQDLWWLNETTFKSLIAK